MKVTVKLTSLWWILVNLKTEFMIKISLCHRFANIPGKYRVYRISKLNLFEIHSNILWEQLGIRICCSNSDNDLRLNVGRKAKISCMMLCAIWYHVCKLKNVKNAHGGIFLSVKLKAAWNFTKSATPSWVLFTFFKLHKWYQIAQSVFCIL